MKQQFSRLTVSFYLWILAVGLGGTLLVRSLVADVASETARGEFSDGKHAATDSQSNNYVEGPRRRKELQRVVNAPWNDDDFKPISPVPTDGSIIHASDNSEGAKGGESSRKTSKAIGKSASTLPGNASKSPPGEPNGSLEANVPRDAPAADVLKMARDRLLSYRSLRAKLSERVMIGENRFTATGNYLQGTQLKLRLDLNIKMNPGVEVQEARLLQVCDGQLLWTFHDYGKKPRITRRDVRQILTAAASERHVPRNVLLAELGLGGLPGLLAGIEISMVFNQRRDEVVDGKSLIVLEGSWNEGLRTQFVKTNSFGPEIPSYIPDSARIYFDQFLLPRRILYLKTQKGSEQPLPMLTLDFSSIQVNGELDDKEFDYTPPDGLFPEDISRQFLDPILRNIKASKKSEKED